jgi:cell wall-associated NlpC family hydrolase
MAPGDLLIVLGGDHVGMYVGNGEVIAAPQPGMDVTISPFAGWWQQSLDAVLAP